MTLNIIRGGTIVVNDNINLVLELAEMVPPAFEETTEEFQPAGSDLSVNITGLGTKPLVSSLKLKSTNPLIIGLYNRAPGVRDRFTHKRLVINEENGAQHEHVIDMTGRLSKSTAESYSGGKSAGYDHEVNGIWEYTELWDGRVMHRFSLPLGGTMVRNFEPVDSRRRSFLYS